MKKVRLYIGNGVNGFISKEIKCNSQLVLYPENVCDANTCIEMIQERFKLKGDLVVFSNSPNVIECTYKIQRLPKRRNGSTPKRFTVIYQKIDSDKNKIVDVAKTHPDCIDNTKHKRGNQSKLLELWFEDFNKTFDVFEQLDFEYLSVCNGWGKKEKDENDE